MNSRMPGAEFRATCAAEPAKRPPAGMCSSVILLTSTSAVRPSMEPSEKKSPTSSTSRARSPTTSARRRSRQGSKPSPRQPVKPETRCRNSPCPQPTSTTVLPRRSSGGPDPPREVAVPALEGRAVGLGRLVAVGVLGQQRVEGAVEDEAAALAENQRDVATRTGPRLLRAVAASGRSWSARSGAPAPAPAAGPRRPGSSRARTAAAPAGCGRHRRPKPATTARRHQRGGEHVDPTHAARLRAHDPRLRNRHDEAAAGRRRNRPAGA